MMRARILGLAMFSLAGLALVTALHSVARNTPDRSLLEPIWPPYGGSDQADAAAPRLVAAGVLEPAGREIAIGAHVSGVVATVFVSAGSRVAANEPLFALESSVAESQVEAARRDVAVAEARLKEVLARIPEFSAEVDRARASLRIAEAEMSEASDLLRTGEALLSEGRASIAEREVMRRRHLLATAVARADETRAILAQAEAQRARYSGPDALSISLERENLAKARSLLARVKAERQLLIVRAPTAGQVLRVNISAGEFAQAGALATPLMTMAGPGPLHVRAEIDDMEAGRFHAHATAVAFRRGEGAAPIPLRFIRTEPLLSAKRNLSGSVAERVDTRVMQILYELPAATGLLPGQFVDVHIRNGAAPTS